jgi:hypothetical protein
MMDTIIYPQEEVIRRVRILLLRHVGMANKIGRWDLVSRVFGYQAAEPLRRTNNNRYDRALRKAIESIRETDLVCSSSTGGGYWLADCMEDIEVVVREYVSRSRLMEQKARDLRRRGTERFGPQIALIP